MTTLEIILISIIAYLLISTFLYALVEHKTMSSAFDFLFGSLFALIIFILIVIFEPIRLIISRIKTKKEKKKYNKEAE